MRKSTLLLMLPLLILLSSAAQPVHAQNDRAVVRKILDKMDRKDDDVDDVAEFSREGRVIVLKLNKRGLSGKTLTEFPAEIFQLTALRGLFLAGHAMKSLPPQIGTLSELIELNVANNNDIGSLPTSIGNLFNLEKLDARFCGLTDLPVEIANLGKLEWLQLWGNGFETLPMAVTQLAGLKELYLNNNKLTTLPMDIIRMPNLRYIDTQRNALCGLPPALDAWLTERERQYKQHQYCGGAAK